ncbi:MAG TPA: hypothetical protein DD658_09420 [Deltaproteobacteria bacterium]|nr:hypothetical protein [Deltaproteobacteria bacterium]
MQALREAGAHIYLPRADQDYSVSVGLRMLTLRHLVEDREGLFFVRPGEVPLLRYYANSIAHLLPVPGPVPAGSLGGEHPP